MKVLVIQLNINIDDAMNKNAQINGCVQYHWMILLSHHIFFLCSLIIATDLKFMIPFCLSQAGENEADYIGRITEFFEGTDRCHYFTCRWFFRAEDTVRIELCHFYSCQEVAQNFKTLTYQCRLSILWCPLMLMATSMTLDVFFFLRKRTTMCLIASSPRSRQSMLIQM